MATAFAFSTKLRALDAIVIHPPGCVWRVPSLEGFTQEGLYRPWGVYKPCYPPNRRRALHFLYHPSVDRPAMATL